MNEKNYYQVLGVNKNASETEIKTAFRKLVRKYHPDVSDDPNADEKIAKINIAYETLSDPEKRAEYDIMHSNPFARMSQGMSSSGNAGGFSGFSSKNSKFNWEELKDQFGDNSPFGSGSFRFDDIFSAFGRGAKTQNQQNHTRTKTNNTTKNSDNNKSQTSFTGFDNFQTSTKGEDQHAKITVELASVYLGDSYKIKLNVPTRQIDGSIKHEQKILTFKVPKGITEGKKIRLAQQGAASFSTPNSGSLNGDLYLTVNIRTDSHIRLDGADVYQTINVTPWEAILGEQIKVETPAGSFDVNIPKNSISGSQLRLKGKGIPAKPAGDLYLVLNIINPENIGELSEEQQQAFQALKSAFADTVIKR